MALDNKSLIASERTREILAQEGFTFFVTGGGSTGQILRDTMYHVLANNDRLLPGLRAELDSVIKDPSAIASVQELEQLDWTVRPPLVYLDLRHHRTI